VSMKRVAMWWQEAERSAKRPGLAVQLVLRVLRGYKNNGNDIVHSSNTLAHMGAAFAL